MDNDSIGEVFSEAIYEVLSTDNSTQVEVLPASTSLCSQEVFAYKDPLKYAHLFDFTPLQLNVEGSDIVKPHYVAPYIREDGTLVEGYYRDGDGDTSIDRPFGMGGGYTRSNPSGE
ncbi:hypothetical protein [Planococcus citreus]|uniref:Uncharacterized protein n=1 Tax=Planococcus citreus TaxID=1373 RepID=A0A497YJ66_9BACL|nr:hypothetical protein [Planococcus citreus]RLJ90629.1 hypothetical protein DFR62_0774 [Planococcus citreus]